MKSTVSKLIVGFFCMALVPAFSQGNPYFTGFQSNLVVPNTLAKDSIEWLEEVEQRTEFSSRFKSLEGDVKLIYSKRPINFWDEQHKLIPIDSELRPFKNNSWAATQQPFPTYLFENGSFAISFLEGSAKANVLTFGKNCKINGQLIQTEFQFTGNKNTQFNVLPGIDKQLIFYENAVKYNYVLHENVAIPSNGIVFSEELELPEGFQVVKNLENGSETADGRAGDLLVKNLVGETVSTIYAPFCYDADSNFMLAAYSVKKEKNNLTLEIKIPFDWLNSVERTFPLVIDPIITGPTTTWNGGSMPSCILPQYNKDSILVTIPADVTITALNVTASFYADPFTSATMNQGSMLFSTSCGNTQTFTITGSTATLPGTGYLENFNLMNPLTCCYTESCTSTNFYLRMHLGRTGPGTGCNTTYIRYDPFTTSWPFSAVVIGKTAETYGGKWVVSQTPICSNTCTITGRAYAIYGVAPYTFSHPWSTDVVTQGTNVGCGNGSNYYQFTLNIPNCPDFCDTNFTTLSVPPAIVTDACGNSIAGMSAVVVPIKTAPQVSVVWDSIVCSAEPFAINLSSCLPNSTVNWQSETSSGTGNINGTLFTENSNLQSSYTAFTEQNGCFSDTVNFSMQTVPLPNANFSSSTEFGILNTPIYFTNLSTSAVGTINAYFWDFGDGNASLDPNTEHAYAALGVYTVCLEIFTEDGCSEIYCQDQIVAPAEISIPNIVTPNEDGKNDLLAFQYLDYYPDNYLKILNRWGNTVYEKENYTNDWNGAALSEGTYFFLLILNGEEKKYSGFFQLVK